MATEHSEPNKFIELKKSIAGLRKDIAFLQKCRSQGITPVSHKIKVNTPIPPKLIRKMELELMLNSIKRLYTKLNTKTLECYSLHLKLAKDFPWEFPSFLVKVKVAEECESERKRKLHNRRFQQLLSRSSFNKTAKPVVHHLEGFVVNRSSQVFTEDEMTLLQKGLDYAVTATPDIEQVIINIDTAIKSSKLTESKKNAAREITAEVIRSKQRGRIHKERKIVEQLKQKPVCFLKADEGNTVVIMDKSEYEDQLKNIITKEPYRWLRSQDLPKLASQVEKDIKAGQKTLEYAVDQLKVTSPILPRISAVPKIWNDHIEMREIISNEGSPTQKLAKWLLKEFQHMPKPCASRSVSSTLEFTNRLSATELDTNDDLMVSFDVIALYSSIPVKETLTMLRNWLLDQYEGSTWKTKVNQYINLTELCMQERCFVFRGEYYKQSHGVPMGSPLSAFLSELFMANFENALNDKGLVGWWRYVDSAFAIIKKDSLQNVMNSINNAHERIRFTSEQEKNGKLPFLDVLVQKEYNTISFQVYRKPTETHRVLPSTSNHSPRQKMAVFHQMIKRLETLPLNQASKDNELKHIFEIARLNGYASRTIQAIIDKRARTSYNRSLTTLISSTRHLQHVTVDFDNSLSKSLQYELTKFGFALSLSSKRTQLITLLGSNKDPISSLEMSGIYKISCSQCDKIYIGQTKRTLETRFKEHVSEAEKAKKGTARKKTGQFSSAIAEHLHDETHQVSTENLKLLRHITDPSKLDIAEKIEICRHRKLDASTLLNKDEGKGGSWFLDLI